MGAFKLTWLRDCRPVLLASLVMALRAADSLLATCDGILATGEQEKMSEATIAKAGTEFCLPGAWSKVQVATE